MPGGRDQVGPLERLTRILLALEESEPYGLDADELIGVADYGSTTDATRQLNRDIKDLTKIGWDIRNVAEPGTPGRYRLHARDTRLRFALSPEHQVELVRAALVAGSADFTDKLGDDVLTAPPDGDGLVTTHEPHQPGHDALDKVAYAAERRCLVRFTYKRRPRVVHPHLVHPGASGWYLVGHEDGSSTTKRFVTGRMSDVVVDQPGTATVPSDLPYDELNPITWEVDAPTDVVVETMPEYEPQVTMMLGTALYDEKDGDRVRLTIRVTHRSAFRARLYELGTRVRVLAPEEIRGEIIAELEQFDEPNTGIVKIMGAGS